MPAQIHMIKALYIPDSKVSLIRNFEDLCRRKNTKFSVAVIALIEAAMFADPSTATRSKVQQPALEAYLTSEKQARKARSKKLDEEWLQIKKARGQK